MELNEQARQRVMDFLIAQPANSYAAVEEGYEESQRGSAQLMPACDGQKAVAIVEFLRNGTGR